MSAEIEKLILHRAGNLELPADPGPDDEQSLSRLHLSDADFIEAAIMLGVPEAIIRGVAQVEASGTGFISDGRPQILFEAHVFRRLTNGKYDHAVDLKGRKLSSQRWDRSLYGPAGAWQHDGRLDPASKMDWAAAHKSCSWGMFQIMGENYLSTGAENLETFVQAMKESASKHLESFVGFVSRNTQMLGSLRTKNWGLFARLYNGPMFSQNRYDKRLAQAVKDWEVKLQ
jgi:hypothetical protein